MGMTQRGDLVTVSLPGDYGKPRPALIVQSDLLTDLDSIVLCPITSELRSAVFRVTVEPNPANGLRALSQVMVDKLSTLPRAKISDPFGHLDSERMKAVERALLLVIGAI
jgi:mRNA interferase MazF